MSQAPVSQTRRLGCLAPAATYSRIALMHSWLFCLTVMAALNLNVLTENAVRLGARLQETLSEQTKDLSLRASGSGYLDNPEEKVKNIGKQLDSNSDREKLDAMKRLVAVRLPLAFKLTLVLTSTRAYS